MIKNKREKNIRVLSNKSKINLILEMLLLVLFILVILPPSKAPLLSPEEFTSLTYDQFNEQVSQEITSGQFGLVQFKNGELTPDNQFLVTSSFTFDTSQQNQVEELLQIIRNTENNQLTFQLTTNFMNPFQQSYTISSKKANFYYEDTGKSCENFPKPSDGLASSSEHTCPSDDNCPKGQVCYHQTKDSSSMCTCWKKVYIGPFEA